jgi:hypothetical protein
MEETSTTHRYNVTIRAGARSMALTLDSIHRDSANDLVRAPPKGPQAGLKHPWIRMIAKRDQGAWPSAQTLAFRSSKTVIWGWRR